MRRGDQRTASGNGSSLEGMNPRADRPFDIVVFGATSFVGRILCRYLVERHGTGGEPGGLHWAIAGRSTLAIAFCTRLVLTGLLRHSS